MKRRLFPIAVAFAIVFIIHPSTFASETTNTVRIQGRVMDVDVNNRMMIVNEKTFVWDQNTKFYNEKGSPVTTDKLRAKTWAYIEGIRDTSQKRVIVEKMYLLPKYISEKEKNLYPFFNEM